MESSRSRFSEAGLERIRAANLVHGGHAGGMRTKEYISWQEMRRRCADPGRKTWKNYGGRGIRVCERWSRYEAFLADMGPCPSGLTLERIDNDGHYEPSNCRWASRAEQNRNQRKNVFVVFDGVRRALVDACRVSGASYDIARWHRKHGKGDQEAFDYALAAKARRVRS